MLSILIPVFNFSVVEFVEDLHSQALRTGIPFEILCYDDGSDDPIKAHNRQIQEWSHVFYHELPQNIGRSAIRNLLAHNATQPYLLFNDCDARTTHPKYIEQYINFIQEKPAKDLVVYGGHTYPEHPPARFNGLLHWTYGREKDEKPASEREIKPYLTFKTINFLIGRSLFLHTKFNETLQGYGHEDTLMALNLRKQGITIHHIDNPVCHIGLVDNQTFIQKTLESVSNAAQLIRQGYLKNETSLSKTYFWLKRLGLQGLGLKLFKRYKSRIREKLDVEKPSLRLLDIYKLGMLLISINQLSDDTNS